MHNELWYLRQNNILSLLQSYMYRIHNKKADMHCDIDRHPKMHATKMKKTKKKRNHTYSYFIALCNKLESRVISINFLFTFVHATFATYYLLNQQNLQQKTLHILVSRNKTSTLCMIYI